MTEIGAATLNGARRIEGREVSVHAPVRRCAIYCRKSVEDRVRSDFSSIDAQREACEEFIRSQVSLGWVALKQPYNDEGFSGKNVDRPALKQLLQDMEAGLIDAIVVYRYDRISRSLYDFLGLLRKLEKNSVNFASVSEQWNTATPGGRFALHIIMSAAELDRATIGERTRDKMRAARRHGKYTGGPPILGFDRPPEGRRLVVNEAEAERVRALFDLYLDRRSLTAVVTEANARGWTTKVRTSKLGRSIEGRRFTTGYLRALLRNPAYVGEVQQDGVAYKAEHPGIVAPEIFAQVKTLRAADARSGGREARNKNGALLKGLLCCVPCNTPMVATHTTTDGRRYRYYACRKTREEGWAACPSKRVPADEIERVVVEQVRAIGTDAALQATTLLAAREQCGGQDIDAEDLRRALGLWDEVWAALQPSEQIRVLALLIEEVGYDGAAGTVTLKFRASGIAALGREAAE